MTTTTPVYAPITRWCDMSGMGRTRVYEELSAGNLRAVKVGNRTLIEVETGLAWLRSLPAPNVRPSRKAAA